MSPEQYRKAKTAIARLNKLAVVCDGLQLGNGGEIDSMLSTIADDLESQAAEYERNRPLSD